MKLIKEALNKRKSEIEIELFKLISLHDKNYLSNGFIALERSNKALSRYLKDKSNTNSLKWAEAWNKLKLKCVEMENKKDYITYSSTRVRLEIELSEINNALYYNRCG